MAFIIFGGKTSYCLLKLLFHSIFPTMQSQIWLIYKQTNINKLFIKLDLSFLWMVWFVYSPNTSTFLITYATCASPSTYTFTSHFLQLWLASCSLIDTRQGIPIVMQWWNQDLISRHYLFHTLYCYTHTMYSYKLKTWF